MTHIEIVTLRLKPGVTAESYLVAARAADAYLSACAGFVSRRLSCSEDGLWTDYLEWASKETAEAAGAGFMADPAAATLAELAEESSLSMRLEPLLLAR